MTWDPPVNDPVFYLGEPEKLIAEQRADAARLAAEAAQLALERFTHAKLEEIRLLLVATTGTVTLRVNMPDGTSPQCHLRLHSDMTWSLEP